MAINVSGFGPKIIWGVPRQNKPVVTAIKGRRRLKFRAKEAARLYIKTETSIREFLLLDKEDHWEPFSELNRNERV